MTDTVCPAVPTVEQVKEWLGLARRYAARLLGGGPNAYRLDPEDVAADAVLGLCRCFDELSCRDERDLRKYLRVAVRNRVIDACRKRAVQGKAGRVLSLEELCQDPVDARPVDVDPDWSRLLPQRVQALLEQLPARQRAALRAWLACPDGSQADCVTWLHQHDPAGDWTETTYRTNASAGRQTLQKWYEQGRLRPADYLVIAICFGGAAAFLVGPSAEAAEPAGRPAPFCSIDEARESATRAEGGPAEQAEDDTAVSPLGLALSSFVVTVGSLALFHALWPAPRPNDNAPTAHLRGRLRRHRHALAALLMSVLALASFLLTGLLAGPQVAGLVFTPMVVVGLSLFACRYPGAAGRVVALVFVLMAIPVLLWGLVHGVHQLLVLGFGDGMAGPTGWALAWALLCGPIGFLGLILIGSLHWRPDAGRTRAVWLLVFALTQSHLGLVAGGGMTWLMWSVVALLVPFALLTWVCLRQTGRLLARLESALAGLSAAAREQLETFESFKDLADVAGTDWPGGPLLLMLDDGWLGLATRSHGLCENAVTEES